LLLATGEVESNVKDELRRTPLSYTAGNEYKEAPEVLLATGQVEMNAKDKSGRTALSDAAENGHDE
jgi:ankyrin repeat domain-containing protein 50